MARQTSQAAQAAATAKDATALKPDECFVFDKNAVPTASTRTVQRVHEMIDGTTYRLHHHEATPVPMKHAVVFLRDPAFRVVGPDGEVMEPVKPSDPSGAVRLGPGQVV